MTIDDAITWLNTDDYESKGFADATSVAISTMRKYQNIEEIVEKNDFLPSWLCLERIKEVLQDEK